MTEFLQQPLPVQGLPVHLLIIDADCLYRTVFYIVGGHLGAVKALLDLQAPVGGRIDTHPDADAVVRSRIRPVLPAESCGQVFQKRRVILFVGAVDVEGIRAAAAADAPCLPRKSPDLFADVAEHPVSVGSAVQLVDHLEMIDVHIDRIHGDLPVVAVIHIGIADKILKSVELCQALTLCGLDGVAVFQQLDALADAGPDDLPGRVGLVDEIHGPQVQALHLRLLVSRQDNDGNALELRVRLHGPEDLHAIHAGHLQIEQDEGQVIPVGNRLLHGLHAVRGEENPVLLLQGIAQQHLVDGLVLDDEDLFFDAEDLRLVCRLHRLFIPGHGTHFLEKLFFLIHEGVRPAEDIVKEAVLAVDKVRIGAGDHHSPALDVGGGPVVQELEKVSAKNIIPAGEDGHEFVPTDPVDGAVGKDLADHPAGRDDILVAGLVAEGVIDLLEAVDIAYDHGKLLQLLLFDLIVDLILAEDIGVFALDTGHGIDIGRPLMLRGPHVHIEVVGQHDEDGKSKQAGSKEHGSGIGDPEQGHLVHDVLYITGPAVSLRSSRIVVVDIPQQKVVGFDQGLPHPDQGDQEHQGQERDPYDDRTAEALLPVSAQDGPEKEKAQYAPYDEEEEGLPLHVAGGDQVGQQIQESEADHGRKTDAAGDCLDPVLPLLRDLERRRRDEGVDQGGADGRDIDDPADRRPADQGYERRDYGNCHNRGRRCPVGADRPEAGGQDLVLAHGIEKPAQGCGIADQTGHDEGQQRQHQQTDTCPAQITAGRVEGGKSLQSVEIAQVPDIGEPGIIPVRISRHGQNRDEDIQQRRRDHSRDKDPEDLRLFKGQLLGSVRNIFEADEGPGRDDRDPDDLGEGGGIRYIAGAVGSLVQKEGRKKDDRDPDGEQTYQDRHGPHGRIPESGTQKAAQQDGDDGHDDFAGVDVIVEDGVHFSEREYTAQKVPGIQGDGCRVGPQDRHVGQGQEPPGEKPLVVVKDLPAVGIGAARLREDLHEIGIVSRDQQHDDRRERHAQCTPPGPRLGQVGVGGDDKRSPADAGSQGKSPCAGRREIGRQFSLFCSIHRCSPLTSEKKTRSPNCKLC